MLFKDALINMMIRRLAVCPQHPRPQPWSSITIFLPLASMQREMPTPSRRIVSIFLPLALATCHCREKSLLLLEFYARSGLLPPPPYL